MTQLRIVPLPLPRLEQLAQDAQDRHDRITKMFIEDLSRGDADLAEHPLCNGTRTRCNIVMRQPPIARQIIVKNDRVALWQGVAVGLFIVLPIYTAIATYIFRAEIAHFLRGLL